MKSPSPKQKELIVELFARARRDNIDVYGLLAEAFGVERHEAKRAILYWAYGGEEE